MGGVCFHPCVFAGGNKRRQSKEEKLERREKSRQKEKTWWGGKETLAIATEIGAEIKGKMYDTEVGGAGSRLHFFVRIQVRDIRGENGCSLGGLFSLNDQPSCTQWLGKFLMSQCPLE